MFRRLIPIAVLVLAVSACNRAAEPELTTTTTTEVGGTDLDSSTTMVDTSTETTEPGVPVETVPAGNPVGEYQIQVAASSDEGEILWVSIPASDYTDRDLEDFVVTVVDERESLYELYVVDDAAAVPALRVDEADRTEEEQALVDAHYLVSLTDGNQVTFHGPFESAEGFVLGS